eukprot:g25046.t1
MVILRNVIKGAKKQGRDLAVVFVDLAKAFDSIGHRLLAMALESTLEKSGSVVSMEWQGETVNFTALAFADDIALVSSSHVGMTKNLKIENGKVMVMDVTVRYENNEEDLEKALEEKIAKYRHLVENIKEMTK